MSWSTFLGGHSNQMTAIVFSPDGVVDRHGFHRRLRPDLERRPAFARQPVAARTRGPVSATSPSHADGRSVITASEDGSARVWSTSVDPVLTLVGRHGAAGRAVAFSPTAGP